jgi:hypothetical protein
MRDGKREEEKGILSGLIYIWPPAEDTHNDVKGTAQRDWSGGKWHNKKGFLAEGQRKSVNVACSLFIVEFIKFWKCVNITDKIAPSDAT